MPQPKKGPRLGSGPAHQRQMLSNLAFSLFDHERIKTTEAKAKMLRPYAERLITKAKKGSIHHRRQVLSVLEDRTIVHKLFDDIAPRFADRNGGYTRILKIGPRNGDGASMALIELVEDGAATVTTGDEAPETGRRRRLRAPKRKSDESLPQDKPARSKAAEAAAAGTSPDGGDVEPPPGEEAESAEAEQAAEASAIEDQQPGPDGSEGVDQSDGGDPPATKNDR